MLSDISTLAFLVSARLFGLVSSCLTGLEGSTGLVLIFGSNGKALKSGWNFIAGVQISLTGGGKHARLDG